MNIWKRSRALGAPALVLALALAAPQPARAERELVDRVVAIVDDNAILLSEVLQEMNLLRLQRNIGELSEADQQQLFKTVLGDMIADQLLVAQAKSQGYEVGDQDLRESVDEALRAIKERIGGEERYRAELQRQGLTEAEVRDLHREQKRKQMLAARVIQTDIRRQIHITDDQVRAYFESHRDSLPPELLKTPESVRLADLLVVPQPAPERVAAARAKIEAAARRVAAGDDFAQVATDVSEWPTARNGGFMGSFRYGDFESDAFDEAVAKLDPGQVSEIFETRFGLQIVKLESRQGDEMTARHIVVKLQPTEDDVVRAFDKAQALRKRILAGESFENLARLESDDIRTRDKGGLLDDHVDTSELRPEFRASIDSLAVGGVSSVIKSQDGFYLFKVVERTESRTATFDDVRENLQRYMEQLEVEKRYRTYLEDLRKRFNVDIKV